MCVCHHHDGGRGSVPGAWLQKSIHDTRANFRLSRFPVGVAESKIFGSRKHERASATRLRSTRPESFAVEWRMLR